MEHIVNSNVMAHLDQHSILKDSQHGFRKKRSCETQLVITIQEIASRLSKGSQEDIILLDFTKSFDEVPHSRLLYKIEYYGIQNKKSAWIQAFLGDRKQEVIFDGAHSTQADVLSGVPQGTVLVQLLFLAYIDDLPEPLRSSADWLPMTAPSTVLQTKTQRVLSSRKTRQPLNNGKGLASSRRF